MKIVRHAALALALGLAAGFGGLASAPPAAAQVAQDSAERGMQPRLDAITHEEWLTSPSVDLVARVIGGGPPSALQRLADNGDSRAQALMGSAYENGVGGFPLDEARAARYYDLAARAGNVLAQYNLGGLYLDGRGVPQDYERAVYWRELAAAQGDRMAMSILGYQYLTGMGVEIDYEMARAYLESAAALDSATAHFTLGMMYEEGIGVPRDLRRAGQYYRRAADLGDPLAAEAAARVGK